MPSLNNLPGRDLSPQDREFLIENAALTDEYLDSPCIPPIRGTYTISDLKIDKECPWDHRVNQGVSPDGLLFAHRQLDGSLKWQWRPAEIPEELKGTVGKYLFAAGQGAQYSLLHSSEDDDAPVLIIEGTKQAHSVACVVSGSDDLDYEVIGIPGCRSWSQGKSTPPVELAAHVDGRIVYILLDADAAENPDVFDGGMKLARALGGAEEVRFLPCPGGGKNGVDDYLAQLKPERREGVIPRLIKKAALRPAPKRPDEKKKSDDDDELSGVDVDGLIEAAIEAEAEAEASRDEVPELGEIPAPGDGRAWLREGGGVKPATIATAIMASAHPVMLMGDGGLAVYRDGVYERHELAVGAIITTLLGDYYSTSAESNALAVLRGLAYRTRRTSEHAPKIPMVNVRNGMLDLRTLELSPHDPKYLSALQLPVEWQPEAEAPHYLEWLEDRVGQAQIPALEECVSQFLDPSRTPPKALFLFGRSHTGKSTFLRIAEKIVGGKSEVAGLSLQQLADDHFAAAELYGKPINLCSDLPKDHVRDLSVFKRVTGDDVITANKKYGKVFTYRSTALFLFSANTVPTVPGEEIGPYLNRVTPVAFPKTFEGKEDPEIEDRILKELPGIFARWARARHAHLNRHFVWEPVYSPVWESFAGRVDRVVRFLASCCDIGGEEKLLQGIGISTESASITSRGTWPVNYRATLRQLYSAFQEWSKGGADMTYEPFRDRVLAVPGVVRNLRSKAASSGRVTNVVIRPMDDWGTPDDSVHLIRALWGDDCEDIADDGDEVKGTVIRLADGQRVLKAASPVVEIEVASDPEEPEPEPDYDWTQLVVPDSIKKGK